MKIRGVEVLIYYKEKKQTNKQTKKKHLYAFGKDDAFDILQRVKKKKIQPLCFWKLITYN